MISDRASVAEQSRGVSLRVDDRRVLRPRFTRDTDLGGQPIVYYLTGDEASNSRLFEFLLLNPSPSADRKGGVLAKRYGLSRAMVNM